MNNKRTLFKGIILLVLVAVLTGLLSQLGQIKTASEPVLKPDSFVEIALEGMEIDKELIPEEEVEEEPVGEVEDKAEEVEKAEKIERVEVPVAPKTDLSSTIANAKSYVYTIDSDLQQGSGFLFNEKGDIVTNAHVAKDAAYITVTNSNGQQFNGRIIGISDKTDIALIRVLELAGKKPMEMELSKVSVGTKVFALGSPENIANTSTEGKITGFGKSFFDDYDYKNLYEMDATIKQGSSGGPLIDANTDRIIGINSLILENNPSIGYAIPIYTVISQLKQWASSAKDVIDDREDIEIEGARLDDELLRSFISSYYELIPYSLNDKKLEYYWTYLLPGSQAVKEGVKQVEELYGEHKVYEEVKSTITSVEIGESEAIVKANATFTYHDQESDEVKTIDYAATFTVVIDEYGDYAIKNIEQ
ncbi:trypsin-like peptidase domain-containing protein [Sporosarcina sp. Marseille-Q4063]|uniref:S1C family serine protease n=1 Tax=Sporosarcina sp. Marseille-Q4063 TaxID=2810514 RepID=UPI001BAEDB16|nr:trypsin-like peptidase domain-containing protein [Sporosarcina sp. Marseille-Q4063]QUW21232.1 trypsin-like peptidase domain-containing protein [Sporosarcina sp. Marseille-Q4063]